MFKKLTILLFILCFYSAVFAQQTNADTSLKSKPGIRQGNIFSLGFEPVFGFNNCFKTDLEIKPLNHDFGIELTPEIYGASHLLNHTHDNISGFGIGLYQKLYMINVDKMPVMFGYGATFRHVNVSYSDDQLPAGIQNDVLKNTSLMLNIYVGARLVNQPNDFFLDLYMGGGYKFSKQQSAYTGLRDYNALVYDYGYKGPVVVVGVKIGLQFTVIK